MSITFSASSEAPTPGAADTHSAVIIGAGFSGIAVAARLLEIGIDDVLILERGEAPGGTWRDHIYPGCACDIPARLYSYSFLPQPDWSRRFAPQAEIQDYLRSAAFQTGAAPKIRYGCTLRGARYNQAKGSWTLSLGDGSTLKTRVLVSARGGLGRALVPRLPGAEQFAGRSVHTSAWPKDLDVRGQRVVVVGTGASAVQLVPAIADQATHLTLLQRTPAWIIPKNDRALNSRMDRWLTRHPLAMRAWRAGLYWTQEARGLGWLAGRWPNQLLRRAAEAHLRRSVRDPQLRALLTPDYAPGCKRLLLSDDFYPAIQKPNVRLTPHAAAAMDTQGIIDEAGVHHPADVVIFATGYRATETPSRTGLIGREGRDLAERWTSAAEAYLGTSIDGFPNFFLINGPNSGLGHHSMVGVFEAQAIHVARAVQHLLTRGHRSLEVRAEVVQHYNAELRRRLRNSIWESGCSSWYQDAQGRNVALWPGFAHRFERRLRRFKPGDYRWD